MRLGCFFLKNITMIEILIKNFSLSKNPTIYNYISQIVSEHEKILQKFLEI